MIQSGYHCFILNPFQFTIQSHSTRTQVQCDNTQCQTLTASHATKHAQTAHIWIKPNTFRYFDPGHGGSMMRLSQCGAAWRYQTARTLDQASDAKHQTPLRSTLYRLPKNPASYMTMFLKRTENSASLRALYSSPRVYRNQVNCRQEHYWQTHKMAVKTLYSSQTAWSCAVNRAAIRGTKCLVTQQYCRESTVPCP